MSTKIGTVINWDPRSGGNIFVEEQGQVWVPVKALTREEAALVEVGTPLTVRADMVAMSATIGNRFDVRFSGVIEQVTMTNSALGQGYLIIRVIPELAKALKWERETILAHWTGWKFGVAINIAEGNDILGNPVLFSLGEAYKGQPRAIEVDFDWSDFTSSVVEEAPAERREDQFTDYWLHVARITATDETRSVAMENATTFADYYMHTPMGLALFQRSQNDQRHWTVFLVNSLGLDKHFQAGGEKYCCNVGNIFGSPEEMALQATWLRDLLKYLVAVSATPADIQSALKEGYEELMSLLESYIGK